MKIGEILKNILKEKGVTQSQLAEKLSVSKQMVSTLVNSESVTTETLSKISKALDIPIFRFFSITESDFEDPPKVWEMIRNLEKKTDMLGDKVNFLHETTVGIEEIRFLALEIEAHAKKGSGLTKLEYDMIKKKFITEYKELKK